MNIIRKFKLVSLSNEEIYKLAKNDFHIINKNDEVIGKLTLKKTECSQAFTVTNFRRMSEIKLRSISKCILMMKEGTNIYFLSEK